ncbi:hypothetical protein BJM06_a00031 (plasmid) [Enterobacter cloacae]|nr:hypothetical protein BJM06_a00031 [Enterobacter cloacae]
MKSIYLLYLLIAIISNLTITTLNYRRAVSGRSDFMAYNNFPEVYHGQGITKPPFSGGERVVTGQGINTI